MTKKLNVSAIGWLPFDPCIVCDSLLRLWNAMLFFPIPVMCNNLYFTRVRFRIRPKPKRNPQKRTLTPKILKFEEKTWEEGFCWTNTHAHTSHKVTHTVYNQQSHSNQQSTLSDQIFCSLLALLRQQQKQNVQISVEMLLLLQACARVCARVFCR